MQPINDFWSRLLDLVKLFVSDNRNCRPFSRYRNIGKVR
jgi:hypothetical protein